MSGRLIVLGAGSALPRERTAGQSYGPAGYVLEPEPGGPLTMLDCGPGSIRSFGPLGLDLRRLERVVFSHYHIDHCLDLFALFFARYSPRLKPLPELELFGPAGLRQRVEDTPDVLGPWLRDQTVRVTEIEVDGEGHGGFEAGGLEFRCRANGHCPEAVSWRVEGAGLSLVYSGDTGPNPVVAELAAGADSFVCECSHVDGEGSHNHLTPTEAAGLARAAGVRRLILTHFYPEVDPEEAVAVARGAFAGEVAAAHDGAVFELRG